MTARERIARLREIGETEDFGCIVHNSELEAALPALLDIAEAAMWYSERPTDGLNETRIELALAKLEGK